MWRSSRICACRRELNSHKRGGAAKCSSAEAAGQSTRSATYWSAGAPSVDRVLASNNDLFKSVAARRKAASCCGIPRRAAAPDTPSRNQRVRCRTAYFCSLARWHKSLPDQLLRRGAGSILRRPRRGFCALHAAHRGRALPNPSLEARPNIKTPGPRSGAGYYPHRGPGVLLLVPPQLER